MSALGQKRTLGSRNRDVRFTPESGHRPARSGMSALGQKQTYALQQLIPRLRQILPNFRQ